MPERALRGKLVSTWVSELGFLSPIDHLKAIRKYGLPVPPWMTASEYTGFCTARPIKIGEAIFFDHSRCAHQAAIGQDILLSVEPEKETTSWWRLK